MRSDERYVGVGHPSLATEYAYVVSADSGWQERVGDDANGKELALAGNFGGKAKRGRMSGES